MNYIRSKSRNKMAPETMDKIVYVRHNRLQLERSKLGKVAASDAVAWDLIDCLDDEELGWFGSDDWTEAREDEENLMTAGEVSKIIENAEKREQRLAVVHAAKRIRRKQPTEDGEADAQNFAVQLQAAAEGVSAEEVRSRSGRSIRPAMILDL